MCSLDSLNSLCSSGSQVSAVAPGLEYFPRNQVRDKHSVKQNCTTSTFITECVPDLRVSVKRSVT